MLRDGPSEVGKVVDCGIQTGDTQNVGWGDIVDLALDTKYYNPKLDNDFLLVWKLLTVALLARDCSPK
jgi:hypothetical protein